MPAEDAYDWREILAGATGDLDAATKEAMSRDLTVHEQLAFAQVQALMVIAIHMGTIAEGFTLVESDPLEGFTSLEREAIQRWVSGLRDGLRHPDH